mmetsp:Transcript_2199/g.8600  ORF Transcript_2199/g.8600 Transcript_2199/m.8600 type:complete len:223 (-) Transcript_2199:389-1057(-)
MQHRLPSSSHLPGPSLRGRRNQEPEGTQQLQSSDAQTMDVQPVLVLLAQVLTARKALWTQQVHNPTTWRPISTVTTNVLCPPLATLSHPTLRVHCQAEVDKPEGRSAVQAAQATSGIDICIRVDVIRDIDQDVVRVDIPMPSNRREHVKHRSHIADQFCRQGACTTEGHMPVPRLRQRPPDEEVQRLARDDGHRCADLPATIIHARFHVVCDTCGHPQRSKT